MNTTLLNEIFKLKEVQKIFQTYPSNLFSHVNNTSWSNVEVLSDTEFA